MQQIQEKSDSISKSLDLSAPLLQSKSLNISRKIIDTSEFRSLNSKIKKDSAKRQQARIALTKPNRKKETSKDTLQIIEPRIIIAIPEIPVKADIVLPEKAFMRKNSDWVLGIVVISLIIIASVRIIFSTYLKQLFNATINYPTAARLFRERTFNLLHAAFRLDMLFYLVFSLFIYQTISALDVSFPGLNPLTTYIFCLAIVIAYSLVRRFIYLSIALVTESQFDTLEYLFNINIYNRVLGIILFPMTLIIAFAPLYNVKLLLITGFAIIAGFFGLTLFRGSKILLKKHFSISYLILYLCTLEFLPLLVIYKLVSG